MRVLTPRRRVTSGNHAPMPLMQRDCNLRCAEGTGSPGLTSSRMPRLEVTDVHRHGRPAAPHHHYGFLSASPLVRCLYVGPSARYVHARRPLPREVSGCDGGG